MGDRYLILAMIFAVVLMIGALFISITPENGLAVSVPETQDDIAFTSAMICAAPLAPLAGIGFALLTAFVLPFVSSKLVRREAQDAKTMNEKGRGVDLFR